MNEFQLRSARLGAVLSDPASTLAMAMQILGVDGAYAAFEEGHPSIPEPMQQRWRKLSPQWLLDRAGESQLRIVTPSDAEWPPQLNDLDAQRPWALWVRGASLNPVCEKRAVAIVGARSCTSYGERTASEFAAAIASQGHVVVSGGAYGIDAAAHRGALVVEGRTIAVLACGVDVAYPSAHAALFDRIASCGTVISEAVPGAHPTKSAFLVRNRLIAALAYGTVVVEARLRSGSISTYAQARAMHRVLMAVPGPVDSPESAGAHALLQDDALLVTSGVDVLRHVAVLGEIAPVTQKSVATEWDSLTIAERQVHEAFPSRNSVTCDALLDRLTAPMTIGELLGALAALAQRGLVAEQLDGSWRRVRRLRGAEA